MNILNWEQSYTGEPVSLQCTSQIIFIDDSLENDRSALDTVTQRIKYAINTVFASGKQNEREL